MWYKRVLVTVGFLSASFALPQVVYGQAFAQANVHNLNVRSGPSTATAVVKKLQLAEKVEVVGSENGWLNVLLTSGEKAYVKDDYLDIERVLATVKVGGALNVRDYPSTSQSTVIGHLLDGEEVVVSGKIAEWYEINQEGFRGFVHQNYLAGALLDYVPVLAQEAVVRATIPSTEEQIVQKEESAVITAPPLEIDYASVLTQGLAIVADAKLFLGNPYVYGGNSLTEGVDCSGFTSQIMARHGIKLSRSSKEQYASNGYTVKVEDILPGDLVFYGYNGLVSHVAIYTGDELIIHANDERTGIAMSSLWPSKNGKPLIGVKRVTQ